MVGITPISRTLVAVSANLNGYKCLEMEGFHRVFKALFGQSSSKFCLSRVVRAIWVAGLVLGFSISRL